MQTTETFNRGKTRSLRHGDRVARLKAYALLHELNVELLSHTARPAPLSGGAKRVDWLRRPVS
jgi:hypothetical protein